MKKLKKLTVLLTAIGMVAAMSACGSDAASSVTTASTGAADSAPAATEAAQAAEAPAEAGSAAETAAAGDETYLIGICQLVQHEALAAATQGFKAALPEKLGDIPVLGTSVTDYATALEISDWTGTVGTNVSGTSDLAPLDQQAAMIKELFPDAKKVGLLYCSAEPNSVYQCDTIEGYLKDEGYEIERYAFTDTNDVTSVTQTACDNSDVIYIPTDNTAASNTEAIANVVLPAGVPAVVGEEGICKGCGVATLSISYYDLGYATGEMAYKILVEGQDVSTTAVETAKTVTKKYNAANCEALNITIPDDYEAISEE